MNPSTIIITETDAKRLSTLLNGKNSFGPVLEESVLRLKGELERATIVPEGALPDDVIAVNSTVELDDLVDGELLTFTVVMPEQADVSEGRISVLAPVGMALLGYRVGDEIEWPVPGGMARMRVRKLIRRSVPEHSPILALS
jgi:regulator of nucleoside diphosphate kinase